MKKPDEKIDVSAFAHLTDDGLGGFEALNTETISLPFIRLLQDLSPACKRREDTYIEGAEPGLFFNSVSRELYQSPLRVVVGRFDRYFLEWKPNRGGFAGAHEPSLIQKGLITGEFFKNEKYQIVNPKNNHIFSDTYIYYVLLPDHLSAGLCLLSLSNTQLKEGRRWNNLLHTATFPNTNTRAKPYHMVWSLESTLQQNDQGSWFGVSVAFDSWATPEIFSVTQETRKALPSDMRPDLKAIEGAEASTGYAEDVPF